MAWWPATPSSENRVRFRRGLSTLVPRGPDSEGVWFSPDDTAYLGHRRLAITGRHGRQPLWTASGDVGILVNGEFYDALATRQALVREGFAFKSDTDSELLLALYQKWGEDALLHLEGEYAFLLWDRAQGKLWLARDKAGVKPLKVAHGIRGLAVASEAKAFFAAGWPSRWDDDSVAQSLALQYMPPGCTLFSGVEQLEPGESRVYRSPGPCVWERSASTTRRWFTTPASSLHSPSQADAADEFSALLSAAVKRRLDTPWPVAVHLSGGLDSSAILALSTRHRAPDSLAAFSVGFEVVPGAVHHDESAFAAKTAARLGVPFTRVLLSRTEMVSHWGDAIARTEAPGINGHLVAKWRLAQAVHEAGFRVVMTGEGADEALLGYSFLSADRIYSGYPSDGGDIWNNNPVSRGIMLPDGEGLDLSPIRKAWGWVPTWLTAKAVFGLRLSSLLKEEWHERLCPAIARFSEMETPQMNAHPVHRSAASWARHALGGYILPTLADAPEAGFGIQGRLPFLDTSVLAETDTWAPSVTGWPYQTKTPLRVLLSRLGLSAVAQSPKHPFEAPPLWSEPSVRAHLRLQWENPECWRNTPFSAAAIVRWMNFLDNASSEEHQRWEPVVATVLSWQHLSYHFAQ